MIYCDTSLLVAAFTNEPHSALAKQWLVIRERRSLAISDWNVTEFGIAIAMKQRRGGIDADFRRAVEQAWQTMRADLRHIPIEARHFTRAAGLADAAPCGLRAGDALHLAIALDHGCEVATFDHDLAAAARALGVAVHP